MDMEMAEKAETANEEIQHHVRLSDDKVKTLQLFCDAQVERTRIIAAELKDKRRELASSTEAIARLTSQCE